MSQAPLNLPQPHSTDPSPGGTASLLRDWKTVLTLIGLLSSVSVFAYLAKQRKWSEIPASGSALTGLLIVLACLALLISLAIRKVRAQRARIDTLLTKVRELSASTQAIHNLIVEDRAALVLKNFLGVEQTDGAAVIICYSHRPGPDHVADAAKKKGERVPLNDDEANLAMRLWAIVAPPLGWERVELHCSCEFSSVGQARKATFDRFANSHLILLGSSKHNWVTEEAMGANRDLLFRFGTDQADAYITRPEERLTPSPLTDEAKRNRDRLIDYALITKMPNPWNPQRRAFVFAGCKAAGQLAVEQVLLLQTARLKEILATIKSPGSKRLQVCLSIHYRYGIPLPELESDTLAVIGKST